MNRAVTDLVSQHGPMPHMGILRCQMERRGRHTLKGYRKRFWVVDERNGRLEVYKNDQEHVPIQVFRAADIRNVIYSDDKQNRFFVMVVQTRGSRVIKFRMASFEERESWSKAITHIMDAYSAINKHKNVLGMVLRRAKTVSDALGVNILIDSGRLLAEVEEDFLQYVAEAVDIALASVTSVVRTFNGEGLEMPRSYILYVHTVTDEKLLLECQETKYNPAERTMTMSVCLSRVMSDRVSFVVTQPDEVYRLVQSSVFRNPVIEGWIEKERNCARACAEIQHYLGLPAAQRSWVTFQWGQNVSNSSKVEAFLQTFVTVAFFERALQSIRGAVKRVERLIAEADMQVALHNLTGSFISTSVRDGGLVSPHTVWHSSMTSSGAMQLERALTLNNSLNQLTNALGSFSSPARGGAGGGLHSREPSTGGGTSNFPCRDAGHELAVQLIRDNVAGLCIQLEKHIIEKGTAPPPIVTVHSSAYEQHCRPAFLLMTKCRRVFPRKHPTTGDVLSDELYEVAHNALLQQQLSSLRTELNSIFERKVKVVIMWDHLFRAAECLKAPLSVEELPILLQHVKGVCLSRLQHVAQVLRLAHSNVPGHLEDQKMLYDTFCSRVGTIVVNFLPYTVTSDASILEPKWKAGVLTDTLYCTRAESVPSLMAALGHVHRGVAGKGIRVSLPGAGDKNILLYAAEAKLGAWCESYCSNPMHVGSYPLRQFLEDEFDSDTDGASVGLLEDTDFGEAVAYERSAEIGLLTMQRVVNMIYDSQHRAPVDLKIGSEDIVRAIHAFVSAFGGDKRPSKHDVARVLTINLQRLRQMYVRAVDDETTSLLTFSQARQLLRDFCEYETNEQYIDGALRQISLLGVEPPISPAAPQGGFESVVHEPAEKATEETRVNTRGSSDPPSDNRTHARSVSSYSANGVDLALVRQAMNDIRMPGLTEISTLSEQNGLTQTRVRANAVDVTTVRPRENLPSASALVTSPSVVNSRGSRLRISSVVPESFDFTSVTYVALTELLPREARLARLAWRVGFVFGLENTGKSLIVDSIRGIARPTVATVGLSQQVVAFDEWVWALQELGGRESFRKNWRYYTRRIETIHFLMFVLDVLDKQTLGEAHQYLREVTHYHHDTPLLVVFNNFREGHRRFDIAEFEALLKLEKLRKQHGAEVLSCVCDITVVHSKNRQLPQTLSSALKQLSSFLLTRSKEQRRGDTEVPHAPKANAFVAGTVVGGVAAAGAGVAPSV